MRNRPTSPHLSIYKPQITSVMSITHRITGVILFAGIMLLSWFLFCCVYYPKCFSEILLWFNECFIARTIFMLGIAIWTLSLVYHQLNGIRHIFWDFGKGHELKAICCSGKIVLLLTVILTFVLWFL